MRWASPLRFAALISLVCLTNGVEIPDGPLTRSFLLIPYEIDAVRSDLANKVVRENEGILFPVIMTQCFPEPSILRNIGQLAVLYNMEKDEDTKKVIQLMYNTCCQNDSGKLTECLQAITTIQPQLKSQFAINRLDKLAAILKKTLNIIDESFHNVGVPVDAKKP